MLIAELEELCAKLQCDDRRPKVAALEKLLLYSENKTVSTADVLNAFDTCYLHLLKCYGDRFEKVRDQAVRTVTQFIVRLPPNDFHMLNVLSMLAQRLTPFEMVEDSEEIRLLCVEQLHTLLQKYVRTGNSGALQQCYADVGRILVKVLRDPYPEVQKEACACVVTMTPSAETYHFQAFAEPLAIAMYSMLPHKHSQVRRAAIESLGKVALHINASGEALSRLLMMVSPLLMDNMPLVRRECGKLGVNLLLELKDRYSYFDRIIPLVLCCLKDDSPDVVAHIHPLWQQAGKQYYDENETELNRQALADVLPPNYPPNLERPSIGCRGLVQSSLRLLKLITRESADWKVDVRVHSLRLLYQFVLHAEAAMTAKFFEIYPDIARACRDGDPIVANEAIKVVDLMGHLLHYDDWFEHAFYGLERNAKGYLKCFYFLFTASDTANSEHLLRLSKLLVAPEFSQTLGPNIQKYVLKLLNTLLQKMAGCEDIDAAATAELEKNIYIATIKVLALAHALESQPADGVRILDCLAERQQSTVSQLHEQYFHLALAFVIDLDGPVDDLSEPVLLLHGLVVICHFRASYLAELQKRLVEVWQHCSDEVKVKIFTAISLAMLNWHETIGCELDKSTMLLRDFVVELVEPHLLWQAGATAESMRSLASATLCSLAQGAPEEALTVLPLCTKYMPSLLEDHATATRLYALKCVSKFGPLKIDELKPIAYATLQRLDDPSSGIRVLAAQAVPHLCPQLEEGKPPEDDHELMIWETFVRKALDLFFLHYDGPEIRLKAAIKVAILQLADKYTKIAQESYQRTVALACHSTDLLALRKELPFAV